MGSEVFGYARVSTREQKADLQLDALRDAGCSRLFLDVSSGKRTARPELDKCMEMLRDGDTLVVWRLDRLGRDLPHLLKLMENLHERAIVFRSLTESIDTSTPMGRLYFQMTGALAEFERNLIVERTRAGLQAARARGRKGGRPSKVTPAARKQMWALYQSQEVSIADICRRYGITPPTFYTQVRDFYSKEVTA